MTEVWNQYVIGSPNFLWEKKLKKIKYALKSWIKKPIPNPTSCRKESVKVLVDIQFSMEDSDISNSLLLSENLSQATFFHSFWREEENLRLKSRSLWLQAGDKNSAYFHRQCRLRISRNHISDLISSEGAVIKGQVELKQAANSHFHQLFSKDGVSDNTTKHEFLSYIPPMVFAKTNASLIKHFF